MDAGMSLGTKALTGIWISPAGEVHLAWREANEGMTDSRHALKPFGWVSERELPATREGVTVSRLAGNGALNQLVEFEDFATFQQWNASDAQSPDLECIRPVDNQFLLREKLRLFEGLRFDRLKRCQLDIETDSSIPGEFSDPKRDRILAIGLKMGDQVKLLCLDPDDTKSEKSMLEDLASTLKDWDPDTIEGHNLFNFDLNYLKTRCAKLKLPCAWGRFGQEASFRKSRLKVAERWIDFQRCDIPGRAVFDTFLMVQLFDVTTRDLPSYGLKAVAKYFGVTRDLGHERTYIEGSKIHQHFRENRQEFLDYLRDDLLETEGVASVLLPTYFEQCRSFPITLQEACLRGNAGKIDLLFFEQYYHARQALPLPADRFAAFEGGYTRSFKEGVFRHVLHYDVASLYPSLLLKLERNPLPDDLGVFLPLLKKLREYRLRFKQLAKTDPDPALRQEYQARQACFKIIINSFYGYLGFPGARFGDGELAAKITLDGRELLQHLIEAMEAEGAIPLGGRYRWDLRLFRAMGRPTRGTFGASAVRFA
jgi:DNA polymerase, archaea type